MHLQMQESGTILKKNYFTMILGVSGWLGNKIGQKEKHVRIAFVLGVLVFGAGVGLYLILWVVKMLSK